MSENQVISGRWDTAEGPVAGITQAVADVTEQEQAELPPMQTVLDTDSLNTLLQTETAETIQISFTYASIRITAYSDGTLELVPEPR